VFYAAVLHLVFYCPFFRWWETVTGRAVVMLSAALIGTLLHTMLTLYGAIHLTVKSVHTSGGVLDDALTWVSVVSLAGAALAVALLAVQALRYTFAQSDNRIICHLLMLGRKFRKT
jgi:hypothetical protein